MTSPRSSPRCGRGGSLRFGFLRSNAVRNLAGVSGANLLARLISLTTLGYSARTLGPELYGQVGYATAIVAYASILLSPGMMTWGVRTIAGDRKRAPEVLSTINGLQLMLALLALAVVVGWTWVDPTAARARPVVLACAVQLFATALSVDWVFNACDLARVPAILGVVGTIVGVVGLLSFVHGPDDVLVVAVLPGVAALTTTAIAIALMRRATGVWFVLPPGKVWVESLRESLPLGATVALIVVLRHLNTFAIGHYMGNTQVGVYTAAFRLWELAAIIPGMLSTVFLPRIARAAREGEGPAVASSMGAVLTVTGLFLAAATFAEAPWIVQTLYGPTYSESVPILRWLGVGISVNFAVSAASITLISTGQETVIRRVVLSSAVLSALLVPTLVPRFGPQGSAATILILDVCGTLVAARAWTGATGGAMWRVIAWGTVAAMVVAGTSLLLQSVDAPLWLRIVVQVPIAVGLIALVLRPIRAWFPANDL